MCWPGRRYGCLEQLLRDLEMDLCILGLEFGDPLVDCPDFVFVVGGLI